jgi:hypothetical protein
MLIQHQNVETFASLLCNKADKFMTKGERKQKDHKKHQIVL